MSLRPSAFPAADQERQREKAAGGQNWVGEGQCQPPGGGALGAGQAGDRGSQTGQLCLILKDNRSPSPPLLAPFHHHHHSLQHLASSRLPQPPCFSSPGIGPRWGLRRWDKSRVHSWLVLPPTGGHQKCRIPLVLRRIGGEGMPPNSGSQAILENCSVVGCWQGIKVDKLLY